MALARRPREQALVALRSVSKRFGGFQAVDRVDLDIQEGSFHALLGENGAGKTTLMRMLAGELRPDGGTIAVDNQICNFRSPRAAREHGIRLVHQHSILIPNLSIAENFLLDAADERLLSGIDGLGKRIREEADRFGISLDPHRLIWELSTTERQWVEVFRALFGGGRILILDEPTAQLSPVEGDALLSRLKALTESGICIVLITHKLREVFAFADTVTVLRKGRWVATELVQAVSEGSLAELMVEDPRDVRSPTGPAEGRRRFGTERLIELENISCLDHRGRTVLKSVSLVLSRGEVLGVAGVSGNGQAQLARIVAGVERIFSGTVVQAGSRGLTKRYIPDDRINVATAATLSVFDNLALRDFRCSPGSHRGLLNMRVLEERASSRVSRFHIKTPSLRAAVSVLSGGNIQRVVVARELDSDPDLVVAHNPTAGLDIATSIFVRGQLVEVASRGGGVLLISDDLDELLAIADRILVLHGGGVVGVLGPEAFDMVVIARLMAGAEGTVLEEESTTS